MKKIELSMVKGGDGGDGDDGDDGGKSKFALCRPIQGGGGNTRDN